MAMVIKSRSSRTDVAKRKKQFVAEVATVGAFAVQFVAAYGPPKKGGTRKEFCPTGELSMAVQIGDGFPATRLKWNTAGFGPLAEIAADPEGFAKAVIAACEAWQNDVKYNEAKARLTAYLADGAPVETPEDTEEVEEPATDLDPSLVAGLVTGCPK